MRMRLLAVGLLVVGCGKVKGEGDVDAPIVDSCEPNAFVQCAGNIAQVCNAAGDGTIDTDCGVPGCNTGAARCNECVASTDSCGTSSVDHCGADGLRAGSDACAAGCTEAPAPHCTYIEPNYAALADACDVPATMPALTIDATQTLDSGSDLVCTGGVLTQTGGPPICVLRFGTITVNANRTLKFIGSRAVALIADAGITVDGTIDVSADARTNGPGGGLRTSGDRANSAIGGGGAGFRNAGGSGGSDAANGGGGAGGAASTNPADLIALIGGARPQVPVTLDADPGGGGGALTLIACRGTVNVSANGVIDAGGGGGEGGFDQIAGSQISVTSAAGGGSGGYVVLQGLNVTVTGSVFANGGAGGGGTSSNEPAVGASGQDGQRSTTAAIGGSPSASGGAGGAGGVGSAVAGVGRMPAAAAGTPGGGGASAGFFQTYTPTGVTPTLTPASASPAFSPNRTLMTR